jgi:hypothetical protein
MEAAFTRDEAVAEWGSEAESRRAQFTVILQRSPLRQKHSAPNGKFLQRN